MAIVWIESCEDGVCCGTVGGCGVVVECALDYRGLEGGGPVC